MGGGVQRGRVGGDPYFQHTTVGMGVRGGEWRGVGLEWEWLGGRGGGGGGVEGGWGGVQRGRVGFGGGGNPYFQRTTVGMGVGEGGFGGGGPEWNSGRVGGGGGIHTFTTQRLARVRGWGAVERGWGGLGVERRAVGGWGGGCKERGGYC